jgi:site-specific recombinase XerC
MLTVLLYHDLRREELCLLKVRDIHARRGVPPLRIHGKGNKVLYVALHPVSAERIHAYLEVTGRCATPDAALFQPMRKTGASITADGIYKCVRAHAVRVKIAAERCDVHNLNRISTVIDAELKFSIRPTRFTNDGAKVFRDISEI